MRAVPNIVIKLGALEQVERTVKYLVYLHKSYLVILPILHVYYIRPDLKYQSGRPEQVYASPTLSERMIYAHIRDKCTYFPLKLIRPPTPRVLIISELP